MFYFFKLILNEVQFREVFLLAQPMDAPHLIEREIQPREAPERLQSGFQLVYLVTIQIQLDQVWEMRQGFDICDLVLSK